MGRTVNVVLPSGRVVAVDEDVAKQAQLSSDVGDRLAGKALEQENAKRSDSLLDTKNAADEGFADAASFGLYGAGREALDPEGARNMRIRAQEHGGARFAGETAALLLPTGEAEAGAEAVGLADYTATGLARQARNAIPGKLAGTAVEGAIQGLGGYVSETNVTGDPLTVEAAVESAGIGAIMNVGLEAGANKLEGLGWTGKYKAAEAKQLAEDLQLAEKGKMVFGDTPPSWDEFVELHDAKKQAALEHNAEVAKEDEKYSDFWQNNYKLTGAMRETDDMLASIQHDVYKKQGGPFAGTPDRMKVKFDAEGKAVGVDAKYEGGSQRFDFDNSDARTIINGPNGEQFPANGAPRVRQVIVDADGRPIISDSLLTRVKEYRDRLSQLYQQKGGGWAMKPGKWISDPSMPADPQGAMEGLRALQEELKQWRPERSGDFKTQLPLPPRPPVPEVPGQLPTSIEDFARKHAAAVNDIAQTVDPTMHGALARTMKDLDLEISGDPAKDLTALHETLRTYRTKMAEMTDRAAKAEAEEAGKPAILRWLRKAVRYTAGRASDTGGAWGAVRRQLGGSAAMKGMAAIEGAVLGYEVGGDGQSAALGATLMLGRVTLRQRLASLVEKQAVNGAALGRKLASPLSYLSSSFLTGKRDPERDPRKQAVNRMAEINSAALGAPDTAFLAVESMLGQGGDIAWKMHQHVVGTLSYLVSTLPKDPGTDTKLFKSNWTPAYHEAVALAHRLEAINDPVTAIARAIAGNSNPAATEALWAVYPATMNELAQELSLAAPNLTGLTYAQASAYSNLFRTPLTGLQQPAVFNAIQGNYMQAQSAAPQPAGPAGGAPKKAVGRPPAVQSPVAGSSVANLTS